MPFHLFIINMSISMKCTVFRLNVPYFYTCVPGKVDRMLAGLQCIKRPYMHAFWSDQRELSSATQFSLV